jgi:hypothetical protein
LGISESKTTADKLARLNRNQNSEFLAQRRKGRKGGRRNKNSFFTGGNGGNRDEQRTSFPLFSPVRRGHLAFLASWREQIPVLDSHAPPENLRKPQKQTWRCKGRKKELTTK